MEFIIYPRTLSNTVYTRFDVSMIGGTLGMTAIISALVNFVLHLAPG